MAAMYINYRTPPVCLLRFLSRGEYLLEALTHHWLDIFVANGHSFSLYNCCIAFPGISAIIFSREVSHSLSSFNFAIKYLGVLHQVMKHLEYFHVFSLSPSIKSKSEKKPGWLSLYQPGSIVGMMDLTALVYQEYLQHLDKKNCALPFQAQFNNHVWIGFIVRLDWSSIGEVDVIWTFCHINLPKLCDRNYYSG